MGHHQLNERCLELGSSFVVSGEEGEGGGGEFEYLGRLHAHSRGRCPHLVHQHLKGRFNIVLARFLHLNALIAILRARREGCQDNSTALRPRHPPRVTYALSIGWMKYVSSLPGSVSSTT